MSEVTVEEWLDRVAALNVQFAHGRRAPYQPLMLMAALIHVARTRDPHPALTEALLKSLFVQLKHELCPNAGRPDSIRMPIGALGKAEVFELRRADSAGTSISKAFAQGIRGRDLMALADHVALPNSVVQLVRRSDSHLVDLLLAVAHRHAETLEASGFRGLDNLRQHWLVASPSVGDEEVDLGTEADVEEALCDGWQSTPFAAQHGFNRWERQSSTRLGRIDVLANRGSSELLVIELKRRDGRDKAVSQVARYIGAISAAPPRRTRRPRVQGIVLTDEISDHLAAAVRGHGHIGLWRYDERLRIEHVAGAVLT